LLDFLEVGYTKYASENGNVFLDIEMLDKGTWIEILEEGKDRVRKTSKLINSEEERPLTEEEKGKVIEFLDYLKEKIKKINKNNDELIYIPLIVIY
jgi:hypothetical protein